MKRFKFVMVSLAIFVASICAVAPRARADDQQEISDLEHKIAIITVADEAMKYYDKSDDVVLFDMMGPGREFIGWKAIHDHFAAFSGVTDAKAEFIDFKVISDGKFALASSVQHYTAKGPDGKPLDMTFRQTDLWHKTDGQWKIIHQHLSFPVDLKTGTADMASKK
jgi:ketosteroid isomerase-like protein